MKLNLGTESLENINIEKDLNQKELEEALFVRKNIEVQIVMAKEKINSMSANVNKIMEYK